MVIKVSNLTIEWKFWGSILDEKSKFVINHLIYINFVILVVSVKLYGMSLPERSYNGYEQSWVIFFC